MSKDDWHDPEQVEVRKAERAILELGLAEEYVSVIMQELSWVIPDYYVLPEYEQLIHLMNASTRIRQNAITTVVALKDPSSTEM